MENQIKKIYIEMYHMINQLTQDTSEMTIKNWFLVPIGFISVIKFFRGNLGKITR